MTSPKKVAALAFSVLIGTGFIASTAYAADVSAGSQATLKGSSAQEQSAQEALALLANSFDIDDIEGAIDVLDQYWKTAYIAPLLDTLSVPRSFLASERVIDLLSKKTGQHFGRNTNQWYFWLWNQPENIAASYDNFKADLYRQIDPKFKRYFKNRQDSARIRLDEIRWGGVLQDGIPPLRNPKMLAAKKAKYLEDDNVVFGIALNGDARAYPKRILAWHEMFVDTIGGVEIAGVYCTLCGTVIPYKTTVNGVRHKLGTSGFLYRSNKLMYDKDTQSLWSTTKGEPVLGPLVDKGIVLEHIGVVTTTWGEWKRRHPDTTVLSLDTGHRRNYGEGVAYQDYFSTDQLMFNTPFSDDRLENKQEVLALRFPASPKEQLAIDTDFLSKTPLYKDNIGPQKLIVLTDLSGANRVYDPKGVDFVSYDQDSTLVDSNGNQWTLSEDKLVAQKGQQALTRLPYRRAFWFGWHAVFPETRLIK